jgi:DEAD/DEAH box helicase domain-containing protein
VLSCTEVKNNVLYEYVSFTWFLQFFFSNPRSLFARPIEAATIDPNNPSILQAHLACAAAEVPILVQEPNEMALFGPYLVQAAMLLRQRGLLGCSPDTHNGQLHYTGPSNKPASTLTLRTIDPGRFTIVDQSAGNVVLEEVEESMAFYQVYDGAVYMFQGKTYLCSSLDFASRVALVKRSDYIKYYTRIVDFKDVSVVGGNNAYLTPRMLEGSKPGSDHPINQELSSSASTPSFLPTSAVFAPALVTTRWLGFLRIQRGTGRLIDKVDLHDYPDMQYETEATYLRLPAIARQRLQAAGLPFRDGVHAASHAVLNVLPLLCIADPADVATECDNPYDTRYKPERILLYDAQSGGVGISCAARPVFTELLKRAFSLVSSCGCTYVAGCPSCVQRSGCGEYNRVLNKTAGLLVLEAALEAEAQKFGLTREQAGLPALPLMQNSFDSITEDE